MLTISSATNTIIPLKRSAEYHQIASVELQHETLNGQWQQAESRRCERSTSNNVYDGELFNDISAVGDYLSAAGDMQSTPTGQIVSVYA